GRVRRLRALELLEPSGVLHRERGVHGATGVREAEDLRGPPATAVREPEVHLAPFGPRAVRGHLYVAAVPALVLEGQVDVVRTDAKPVDGDRAGAADRLVVLVRGRRRVAGRRGLVRPGVRVGGQVVAGQVHVVYEHQSQFLVGGRVGDAAGGAGYLVSVAC